MQVQQFYPWENLSKEQQKAVQKRFCTNCLSKGRYNCNPDTFPYYEQGKPCDCSTGGQVFYNHIPFDMEAVKKEQRADGTVLQPAELLPGNMQWCEYCSVADGKSYYQMDYRHYNGDLFTCVKQSLTLCEAALYKWLFKNEYPVVDNQEYANQMIVKQLICDLDMLIDLELVSASAKAVSVEFPVEV